MSFNASAIIQTILHHAKTKNYFALLGLKQNATKSDIDHEYKKLVVLIHPDHNIHNEDALAATAELNNARDELLKLSTEDFQHLAQDDRAFVDPATGQFSTTMFTEMLSARATRQKTATSPASFWGSTSFNTTAAPQCQWWTLSFPPQQSKPPLPRKDAKKITKVPKKYAGCNKGTSKITPAIVVAAKPQNDSKSPESPPEREEMAPKPEHTPMPQGVAVWM
jgi:curved DNA-binding protein CbpA